MRISMHHDRRRLVLVLRQAKPRRVNPGSSWKGGALLFRDGWFAPSTGYARRRDEWKPSSNLAGPIRRRQCGWALRLAPLSLSAWPPPLRPLPLRPRSMLGRLRYLRRAAYPSARKFRSAATIRAVWANAITQLGFTTPTAGADTALKCGALRTGGGRQTSRSGGITITALAMLDVTFS